MKYMRDQVYADELFNFIKDHFNQEELKTLCFELGDNFDYESLVGEGREGKARELTRLCVRREKVMDLLTLLRKERPEATSQINNIEGAYGRSQQTKQKLAKIRKTSFVAFPAIAIISVIIYLYLPTVVNFPPVAIIGSDQYVKEREKVILDGSHSQDGNPGTTLSYRWSQVRGEKSELSDNNIAKPTFSAPSVNKMTNLSFQLVVSDGTTDSEPAVTNVSVEPIQLPCNPNSTSILKIGSKGTIVGDVQKILQSLGYYHGRIDNDFGPLTEQATRGFEMDNQIASDGVVGHDDWPMLCSLI